MKLLMITLLASSTLSAQAAGGERSSFPPALETFLGLVEGQAEAIVDANDQFRNDPLRQERADLLRLKRQDLSEALNIASPDPGVIGTLAVDIELLDRELRALREEFQQEMLARIFGVSTDDEAPAGIVERLNQLERAKRIEPLYDMAVRFTLVDSPREVRQSRRDDQEAPPAK